MRAMFLSPMAMGRADFGLTTLPEFLGQLFGLALLLLPWLLLRRWKWGRWAMIAFHTVIALGVVAARSNPYYPAEDQPSWMLLLGLPAVLVLAGYDRRKREVKEPSP